MRRASGLGFLLCGALGFWLSCDSLWGGLVKNNPDNCFVNTSSCSADEFCSAATERCTPNSQSCVQNPGICAADQTCNPTGQLCVSKLLLTQVTPAMGPDIGGARITITGDFFKPGISAYFDDHPAGNLILAGPTSLSVDLPPRPRYAGPASVKLVQLDGATVSSLSLFSYFLGSPDFSSFKTVSDVIGGSVLTADFNSDGRQDLVAAQDTTLYVSLGKVNERRRNAALRSCSHFGHGLPTACADWRIASQNVVRL